MRGIIEANSVPVKNETLQSMKRFAEIYEKFRQNHKLPLLQRGHSLFLKSRTLRLEPQYVYRKGEDLREDNAYVVVGAPRRNLLSQIGFAPNLSDKSINVNLVGSLRKKVKGEIFDCEILNYPLLVFLPHTFFFLKVNHAPAAEGQKEFSWASSNRWALPEMLLEPGDNFLMSGEKQVGNYPGHPFYTPALEEWGDAQPSADTFAQLLKVIFMPLRDGKYKPDLGEIVMISFLNLAYPDHLSFFGDYITLLRERMGLNLLEFLNYAK